MYTKACMQYKSRANLCKTLIINNKTLYWILKLPGSQRSKASPFSLYLNIAELRHFDASSQPTAIIHHPSKIFSKQVLMWVYCWITRLLFICWCYFSVCIFFLEQAVLKAIATIKWQELSLSTKCLQKIIINEAIHSLIFSPAEKVLFFVHRTNFKLTDFVVYNQLSLNHCYFEMSSYNSIEQLQCHR